MSDPGASKPVDEESLGFLVAKMTEQTSELVRSEVALAKAEMAEKGKSVGIGVGAFGGAGLLALYGLGVLLAAAVLGLAEALPAWLSALIVAVVLFAIAGIAAIIGKKKVAAATPAKPEQAIEGVKQDIAVVKDGVTGDSDAQTPGGRS